MAYMGALSVPGPVGLQGRFSGMGGGGGGGRRGASMTAATGKDSFDESYSLLMELVSQVPRIYAH
jgi:hypothetical protein